VLVRPRAGDFVYSAAEHRTMLEQIRQAKAAGAHGIVTGELSVPPRHAVESGSGGEVATERTADLIAATRPLPVTFHRAFDACADLGAALETLIRLGVERVLTSGGAKTAAEGAEQIGRLVKQVKGRIAIVAGGGIDADNVTRLVRVSRVREVHFRVNDSEKVRRVFQALKGRLGEDARP
jgi:copper homeostasis protein